MSGHAGVNTFAHKDQWVLVPGGPETRFRWRDAIWLAAQTRLLRHQVKLLLVGAPPGRALEQFAAYLNVTPHVWHLPRQEVEPWLDRAAALLDFREAGPASPLLAAAKERGLPLVLSDTPEHRQWVTDCQNGFLVRPGNVSDYHRRLGMLLDDARWQARFAQPRAN